MCAQSPARNRRHILTWGLLGLASLAGVLYWCRLGIPVAVAPAPSGRMACVSYSPFHEAGASPLHPGAFVTPARIERDLARLSKRFECVRTYSQSNGLDAVPNIARQYGMKVLLGIWLSADRVQNLHEVQLGIRTALSHPHTVRAIVVGNEVLLRGDLTARQLVAYIRHVRQATHMPVTYADVWEYWLRYAHSAGLAHAVSFVTVHILPYWEDEPVSIEHAIGHVNRIYARVRRAFPGKTVLIGETGWPSAGKPRRGSVPGLVNEARYIRSFLDDAQARHIPYNLIESFDQPWKRGQEGTVGGHWGLYNSRGEPKFALTGKVVEMRRWWLGLLAMGGCALLFSALTAGSPRRRLAGGLAGAASGAALAAATRQMLQALTTPWAWSMGVLTCAAALLTALACIRPIARWLDAQPLELRKPDTFPARVFAFFRSPHMHLAWLVAASWVDLLLVFDGRYRDYPDAALLVPAGALALWLLVVKPEQASIRVEYRFLACWMILAALFLLAWARAANLAVWSWFLCNGLLTAPVIVTWLRCRFMLQPHQAQAANE